MDNTDFYQLQSILEISEKSKEYMLNNLRDNYFSIDTVFLTTEGFDGMWKWLSSTLEPLMSLTKEISEETSPHRFHRILIIPDPNEITNNFKRKIYRQIIKTVIHYHLWHGIVCYVTFVSSRNYPNQSLIRKLDFGSLTSKFIVFDTTNFFSKSYSGLKIHELSKGFEHIKFSIESIYKGDLKQTIQLYYDPDTFISNRRKNDSQYRNLKIFLHKLDGDFCPGPDCGRKINKKNWSLDHIVPQGQSNNVILNLRLLCDKCNSHKWKLDIRENPFEQAFIQIPDTIASQEIKKIISEKPPNWVNRYNKQPPHILKYLEI